MDERALLARLKSGDQAAFDSMFRDHYPHLVTFGQSLLRDRAAAEDVAQEVMLELWRRREDIVIQESLRAYLLRATRNRSRIPAESLDCARKYTASRRAAASSAISSPITRLSRRILR